MSRRIHVQTEWNVRWRDAQTASYSELMDAQTELDKKQKSFETDCVDHFISFKFQSIYILPVDGRCFLTSDL